MHALYVPLPVLSRARSVVKRALLVVTRALQALRRDKKQLLDLLADLAPTKARYDVLSCALLADPSMAAASHFSAPCNFRGSGMFQLLCIVIISLSIIVGD